MKDQRNFAVAIYFLVLILMALVGAALSPSQYPAHKQNSTTQSSTETTKQEPTDTFWGWLTKDPVVTFTGMLAGFTGVLAVSTIGLWAATYRSSNIAEDALVSVERAFVSFGVRVMVITNPAGNAVAAYHIIPVLTNSGSTPTRYLYMHNSWDCFEDVLPDDFPFHDGWFAGIAQQNTRVFIGPKASIEGNALVVPVEILESVRVGQLHAYIWGWAEYDDVFETTPARRTEYCNEITVWDDPYPVPTKGIPPINLRMVDCHTGADDECYYKARPKELRNQPI